MKQIKIHAFFGKNLGDDLMVEILLKRYPKLRFYYDGSDDGSDVFLKHANFKNRTVLLRRYGRLNHALNLITAYKKEDFFFHRLFKRQEKKSCCGVLIGGSMYMQLKEDPSAQLKWEEERFGKLPRIVIGVNFGPYQTASFKEGFTEYFRRSCAVTFRDKTSYEMFSRLPSASYAPDVVFNLDVSAYDKEATDHTVLISVIDVPNRPSLACWEQDYERFIVGCCEACILQGKKPVLMSFCKKEGDEAYIQKLLRDMQYEVREKTATYFYDGNTETAKQMFAKASFVVATRFHAMILALRFGKPFFSIAYSDKVKWVLQDVGSNTWCSLDELGQLDPEDIFTNFRQPEGLESYMLQAVRQFEEFDRFMNDE